MPFSRQSLSDVEVDTKRTQESYIVCTSVGIGNMISFRGFSNVTFSQIGLLASLNIELFRCCWKDLHSTNVKHHTDVLYGMSCYGTVKFYQQSDYLSIKLLGLFETRVQRLRMNRLPPQHLTHYTSTIFREFPTTGKRMELEVSLCYAEVRMPVSLLIDCFNCVYKASNFSVCFWTSLNVYHRGKK